MSDNPRFSKGWVALRLTDDRSVGYLTLGVTTFIFAIDRIARDYFLAVEAPSGSLAAFILELALFQCILFLSLKLSLRVYLRRPFSRRHASVPIITVYFSALWAALVSQLLVQLVAPFSRPRSGQIVLDWFFVEATLWIVTSLAIVGVQQQREVFGQLLATQVFLKQSKAQVESTYRAERKGQLDRIREVITSVLHALDPTDPRSATDSLRNAATEIVRPMSHRLATERPHFSPPERPAVPSISWRRILREVTSFPLIAPRLMGVCAVAIGMRSSFASVENGQISGLAQQNNLDEGAELKIGPAAVTVIGNRLLQTLLILVAIYAATWLMCKIADRWLGKRLTTWSLRRQWVITYASLIVIGLTSQWLASLIYVLPGMPPWANPGLFQIAQVCAALMGAASLIAIVRASQARTWVAQRDLETLNTRLTWDLSEATKNSWAERERLSRLIHGPLQASLNAGALRCDIDNLDTSTCTELFQSIESDISRALDLLEQPPSEVVALAGGLKSLQTTWADVCAIEVNVDPALIAEIESSRNTAEAVLQVLTEATANSAIRAHASHIVITIEVDGTSSLSIVVRDDGRKSTLPEDQHPGLGSRILDDVCSSWNLETQSHGATLTASMTLPTRE